MKTSAKKSSTTTSTTVTQAANQPFFAKAGVGNFFAPVTRTAASTVQMKMTVNKPGDKFEQEADTMAGQVMRMPTPVSPVQNGKVQRQEDEDVQRQEEEEIQRQEMPEEEVQRQEMPEEQVQRQEEEQLQRQEVPEENVQRQEEEEVQRQEDEQIQESPAGDEELQRKGSGTPAVHADTQSSIQHKTTGGQALSADVRSYMEPRFGADFSNVRVHSDAEAASLSNQLSARAFTYQNHIFFSRDQYQPGTSEGQKLLAHELTHTIQQGHAVQRSPQISTTTTPPPVQRLGVQDALDYFADKAYYIPGFRMLTIVLGVNPINMRSTDRSAANILRALIELVPGGHLITQALDNHGVFTKAGAWVEQQLGTLGDIGSDIVEGLRRFLDSLGWTDIFDLGDVWDRAKRIFTTPISRLIAFAGSVVSGIMRLVKEAVLRPLAAMAEGTRGYDLLKAVLGQDPITGDPVPRNAETLIGGFMKLIGQEEVWENIKKGNAVARAWAWFQGALAGLMGFVLSIPAQIIAILSSITWQDVVTIVGVFAKVGRAFLNIAGEFVSWAGRQVLSLLEIIFAVVAPGAVPYLKRAQGAFRAIIQNPIGFVGNLVRAGKMGFEMFASRIGDHLKSALIKWIVGPLGAAGVYIPKSFSLMEIIKLVLSVLGLTWQNIRAKLVKIIPEPVLTGLEKTVGILVTLVKEGPVAAWEQIKADLSELKDSLIAQITQMVITEVVKAAVVKLASMLNPAGAVIQAIIAIYNTIMFFIQKINEMAAVVGSFINSIAAIAAGQITNAAKRVEQTMANALTVVIAFLAKFAGLGNIPEKIVGIIRRIRQPIDKGLDKIVTWLGNMLQKAGRAVAQAGLPADPNERLRLGLNAATTAVRRLPGNRIGRALIVPLLSAIRLRYGFTSLEPEVRSGTWWIRGVINPAGDSDTGKQAQTSPPVSPIQLAGVVRRVLIQEISSNPAVRSRTQQPVGQTITVGGGPLALPAAALQSRTQLQQHRAVSGRPFVILAGDRPNIVQINIGGGTVEERRARAGPTGAPLERVMGFPGRGHYRPDVLNEITTSGISEPAFAKNVRMLVQEGRMEPGLTDDQRARVRRVTWLMFGTESARNLANIVHAPLATGMVEAEQTGYSSMLTSQTPGVSGGILPATMGQLPATARTLEGQLAQSVPGLTPREGGQGASALEVQALVDREYSFVMPYIQERAQNDKPSEAEADTAVRNYIRLYYRL